jgi:hypothetical protein
MSGKVERTKQSWQLNFFLISLQKSAWGHNILSQIVEMTEKLKENKNTSLRKLQGVKG